MQCYSFAMLPKQHDGDFTTTHAQDGLSGVDSRPRDDVSRNRLDSAQLSHGAAHDNGNTSRVSQYPFGKIPVDGKLPLAVIDKRQICRVRLGMSDRLTGRRWRLTGRNVGDSRLGNAYGKRSPRDLPL